MGRWPHCPNGCGPLEITDKPAHCPDCGWQFEVDDEQKEAIEKHREAIRDTDNDT